MLTSGLWISPHVVTTAAGTWETVPAQALVNTMATAAMTTTITAQPLLRGLTSHLGPRVITNAAGTWEAAPAQALVNAMATVAMTTTLPACQPLSLLDRPQIITHVETNAAVTRVAAPAQALADTKETVVMTTTITEMSFYCTLPCLSGQPSCRYNCGRYMGSCSCSSSCRYNGNCCYDYYSYCSRTSTVAPTTGQPSCRYNCGRYMGSCSCSSSCRYNGNCCYDYYSYCSRTSTVAPTTGQPSCRYNCGYSMGSCSCSSSCRYYGNCCNDYYCTYRVTQSSENFDHTNPCGGHLFGSGTFSSPNHPNHYQDNAYCVWQLRAAYDQRIFLSFTYLQLENCCSCDYIGIYDGPSTGSRYLGKVCNNSLSTFYSTSNYLTVLFRTDGSVVGRGFSADYISSLSPSSGRVDCSSDNMNIVIERTYLSSLGYDGQSLYLNDPHCRPQVSRYQVVFNFPMNTCGNVRKFENGRVVYTNTIRAYTSSSGEITRQSHLKLNVGCRMEQDSVAQIMYVVRHHDNSSITGTGRFNTSMDFYTSSGFYYKVTQVPYEVTLNQNLYVQVDLRRGDSSLVLFLDTCVTSPSPHDFHTRPYYLVRNGCSVDNTYRAYSSGTNAFARFTFKAFQFLRATESVYIQCKVLVCQASDYNSRCRRGCHRRVARDLGSEHDSETLVLGPIQLKEPEKKEEETPKQDKA
ncbi:CUB and zona pellucida-like domain-containing protein 1 isoform X3 [Sebastes fasciatus]|uniref:CUB and zona pellucida-like domain-containing protein 1 isoform X3 n=1 Tax=Sebastes fasciatus TaxID=394691 RepID=UPI003D9E4CFF